LEFLSEVPGQALGLMVNAEIWWLVSIFSEQVLRKSFYFNFNCLDLGVQGSEFNLNFAGGLFANLFLGKV
jgi:hypothetical protein